MGIAETLGRIPKILEANLNALLDKCEDPEKMIDQLLIDYKRDLADVKRDTAAVMSEVKIAEKRLQECDEDIERKKIAAANAIKAGNDADARTLISAKQSKEKVRETLLQNLAIAQKNAEMMQEGYNRLCRNIQDLEQRKEEAKAKIAMAKAQEKINETAAKANININTEAFEKYEAKAEKMLAEAQAKAELDAQNITVQNLEEKYTTGTESSSVDEELAALKAEMGL